MTPNGRRQLAPAEVLALARALAEAGRLADAERAYRHVLAKTPDEGAALGGLGAVLIALGRAEDADAPLRRAPAPLGAEACRLLALSLAARGLNAEALPLYRRTLTLAPTDTRAFADLGRALGALEQYEEAAARLSQAMDIGPPTAEALNDLGAYLSALGRHEEAARRFESAVALAPDFAFAHNNLGNALATLGRHREAVTAFRAALTLDPAFAEAYANLGAALADLRHPADALPLFERALALNPHLPEAHHERGEALVALGHLDDARDSFLRAIALRPDRGEYYHGLARCSRLAADDPHFLAMLRLIESKTQRDESDRIQLHFALAKAYEDQGRFAPAFAHLSEGNALRRAHMPYDEAETLARLGRFARAFDPVAPTPDAAPDTPIFIVGMPRSGSTLVEQILASHPSVFGAGELPYFIEEAERLDPSRALDCAALAEIGARYRRRLQALAPGAPRITDKQLSNFQYLGLIRLALPGARIIHTRRDPVDTCLSCYAQTFSAAFAYSNDLGDLGRYYRAYDEVMRRWRALLPGDSVLDVQYEDLVADFETQARRIVDFCGLAWDARCLDFHETPRSVITASAAQVRQPIYQRSSGRAQKYGPLLQPLIDALGPDLTRPAE